ncbi:unnamed protein product [Colias eurytheme]|nr:unnamed protein product [Colias eurytheme]
MVPGGNGGEAMEPPKTQSCVLPQHDPTQRAEGCLTVLRTDDLEQGEHDTHVGQTNTKKVISYNVGLTVQINTSQAENVGQKNTSEAARIMADDDTKPEHDACQAMKPPIANNNNTTKRTNKNRNTKKTPILENELASIEDTNNKSRPEKAIVDDDASTAQAHETCRAKKTISDNDTSTEQRNAFLAKKTLPATNDASIEQSNTSQASKTIAHNACPAKKTLLAHNELASTERIDITSQANKTLLTNNSTSTVQRNKTRQAKKTRNISRDKKTSLITENKLVSTEQINTNQAMKTLLADNELDTTVKINISQAKKIKTKTELDKALLVDNDTTIEKRNTSKDKSTSLIIDNDAMTEELNSSQTNTSTEQRNTSQVKKSIPSENYTSTEQTNNSSEAKKTITENVSTALTRLDAFNLLVAESKKINGRSAKPSDLNNEERLSVIKSALGDALQPQFTEDQQIQLDEAISNFISKIEKKYKDCRSFMPNFTRKNRNWLNKMFISDVPQDLIKCDFENVDIATELKDLQPSCSNESHQKDFST